MEKIIVEVNDPEIEALVRLLKMSGKGSLSTAVKASLLYLFTNDDFLEKGEMLINNVLSWEIRSELKKGRSFIEVADGIFAKEGKAGKKKGGKKDKGAKATVKNGAVSKNKQERSPDFHNDLSDNSSLEAEPSLDKHGHINHKEKISALGDDFIVRK